MVDPADIVVVGGAGAPVFDVVANTECITLNIKSSNIDYIVILLVNPISVGIVWTYVRAYFLKTPKR